MSEGRMECEIDNEATAEMKGTALKGKLSIYWSTCTFLPHLSSGDLGHNERSQKQVVQISFLCSMAGAPLDIVRSSVTWKEFGVELLFLLLHVLLEFVGEAQERPRTRWRD